VKIGVPFRNVHVSIKPKYLLSGDFGDVSSALGSIWRFAPMADPLVEEFHSRDLGK
jgi:hypothetical protein